MKWCIRKILKKLNEEERLCYIRWLSSRNLNRGQLVLLNKESVCLFVCLFVCLSVCLSLSVSLSICLCVSVHLPACLSVHLSICLLSVNLSGSQSDCQPYPSPGFRQPPSWIHPDMESSCPSRHFVIPGTFRDAPWWGALWEMGKLAAAHFAVYTRRERRVEERCVTW